MIRLDEGERVVDVEPVDAADAEAEAQEAADALDAAAAEEVAAEADVPESGEEKP